MKIITTINHCFFSFKSLTCLSSLRSNSGCVCSNRQSNNVLWREERERERERGGGGRERKRERGREAKNNIDTFKSFKSYLPRLCSRNLNHNKQKMYLAAVQLSCNGNISDELSIIHEVSEVFDLVGGSGELLFNVGEFVFLYWSNNGLS